MDRSYVERNKATRERLVALLAATSDSALEAPLEGWSGSALIAHLAFWDRMVKLRWEHATSHGLLIPAIIDSTTTDFINDGQVPEWTAIPARLARELALAATEACDQHVAGLPDANVEAADNTVLYRLLDRSIHRTLHLDSLEAALAARR